MELAEFLVRAKINTYVSTGDPREARFPDGKRQLIYEEEGWKYMDVYYGSNPFSGEEVVWKDSKLYWSMNYYGKCLGDVNPKEVYAFVRKAMRQVKSERPFRGPAELSEGDWRYSDISEGNTENFTGREEIYLQNRKVYNLLYCGGLIKD